MDVTYVTSERLNGSLRSSEQRYRKVKCHSFVWLHTPGYFKLIFCIREYEKGYKDKDNPL